MLVVAAVLGFRNGKAGGYLTLPKNLRTTNISANDSAEIGGVKPWYALVPH